MAFVVAIAGAIGSAIGAVGTFIGGFGAFAKLAIGIGINLAVSYLQRKKQGGAVEPGGVKVQTEFGTDVPRQVAMGYVGIAGHEVYVNTYHSDNKWLQDVYQVSDYPCTDLTRVAINGEWVTLDRGNPDPQKGWPVTSGEYAGLAWVKFYDGKQTVADPALVSNANPSNRWTSKGKGIGNAYVIVTARYDREKTVGRPDMFFEVKGAPLYDPRKDSTVGGSGSHRWGDINTHEFTENPILMDYNYRRGLSINGDMFCGMQMDAGDLPLDKYISAANVCDETVNGEARYRCSVMVDCTATHGDNIQSFMKSCGGVVVDAVDGSWPIIGAAQPVVATIYDDDLVPSEANRWQAKRSMSEIVNSISGTHPDPDQLWSMVGYESVVLDSYQVIDRRTRDLGMDFPQVRSSRQAKQLASIYALENRLEATAEITVRPRWQVLKAGDWIRWDSARHGNKVYIVVSRTLVSLDGDKPRAVRLALQERDASIYAAVTLPVPVVPYPPGKPVYLQEVQNFQLAAVTAGANDKLMPAIQASWSAIDDVTVIGVDLEWWPVDQPSAVSSMRVSDDETVATLIDGVVSSTEYAVRTRLVTSPRRVVVWSDPDYITTSDQAFTDIDREAISEAVNDATDWIGWNTREEIERARRNIILDIEQDAANYLDKQQLRREVTSTTGAMNARWSEDITLLTGEQSALAQRLEVLEVTVEEDIAEAVDLLTVEINNVDGRVTANSNSIQSLTTRVDDVESSVTIRGQAQSSPGGGWARWGVQVKTGSGNNWSSAAFFLDTNGSLSRAVFKADEFIITDGSNTASPFVFRSGTAYFENARIGTVYFDQLSSNNGKLLLKGSGSNASIEIFN